eukprot:2209357-Rhodomonas_salina.1
MLGGGSAMERSGKTNLQKPEGKESCEPSMTGFTKRAHPFTVCILASASAGLSRSPYSKASGGG